MCCDRRDIEHRRRLFVDVGKVAGAGQRILAPRRRLLPFGAHRRDIVLDEPAFERRPGAASFLDLLELRPGDGAELAGEILDIRADMPIIMCTGFSYVVDADKAKQAGIRSLAMKPLTKKEIARTVRKVLDE